MSYHLIYRWGSQNRIYSPQEPADIWYFLENNPHIKPVSIFILEPFYARLMAGDEITKFLTEVAA